MLRYYVYHYHCYYFYYYYHYFFFFYYSYYHCYYHCYYYCYYYCYYCCCNPTTILLLYKCNAVTILLQVPNKHFMGQREHPWQY